MTSIMNTSITSPDDLNEIESAFFLEAIKEDGWIKSIIEGEKEEPELIYDLSEAIRLEVIEQHKEEIDKLSNKAYKEVLMYAISSARPFKIASAIYESYFYPSIKKALNN